MAGKADSQKSGLAGELFVAAELLKRGYQVSLTMSNAKAVDLFVYNERTDKTFTVQVKALRSKNYFPLEPDNVNSGHVYAFVLLNKPDEPVEFFITDGSTILADKEMFFGKGYESCEFNGIKFKSLLPYKNNWAVFE